MTMGSHLISRATPARSSPTLLASNCDVSHKTESASAGPQRATTAYHSANRSSKVVGTSPGQNSQSRSRSSGSGVECKAGGSMNRAW